MTALTETSCQSLFGKQPTLNLFGGTTSASLFGNPGSGSLFGNSADFDNLFTKTTLKPDSVGTVVIMHNPFSCYIQGNVYKEGSDAEGSDEENKRPPSPETFKKDEKEPSLYTKVVNVLYIYKLSLKL